LGRLRVGWEKVACWSTKAAISLKCVKIEEKLLWRAYKTSPSLSIFWITAIFLLPVLPLRPPRRPFCLIFACTAQPSVLDGTNGHSSSEPCAYCRIVQICQKCQGASRGHLCDSTAFLLSLAQRYFSGPEIKKTNLHTWPLRDTVVLRESIASILGYRL